MKTIGFIDHYIDEWHANNYPSFIGQSDLGGDYRVAMAWEETTPEGKKPLSEWCREYGARQARSLEEVVETCDYLMVLSPNNPERHESLADLPLRSGKPVYIDKPLALSLATARRLLRKAQEHRTSLMSCSALRYAPGLQAALAAGSGSAQYASTRGPGNWANYAIHQVEMLVMALGTGAARVMACAEDPVNLLVVDYLDRRCGLVQQSPSHPFQISIGTIPNRTAAISEMDGFFPCFIDALLAFFDSGISSVPVAETLEIVAILDAGSTALTSRNQWHDLPLVPEPAGGL